MHGPGREDDSDGEGERFSVSEKQGKREREVPVIQSPSPSPPPTKCHTCACHIISGHPSNIIPGRVISHQAALCGHKGEGAPFLSPVSGPLRAASGVENPIRYLVHVFMSPDRDLCVCTRVDGGGDEIVCAK
jgi:hypothetical protein